MNALQLEEKEPIVYYDENEIVFPEESDLDVKDLRHAKKIVNFLDFEDFEDNVDLKYKDIKKYIFNLYKIQEILNEENMTGKKEDIIKYLDKIIETLKSSNSQNVNELVSNTMIKKEYLLQMLEKGVEAKFVINKLNEIIDEVKKEFLMNTSLNKKIVSDKMQKKELSTDDLEIDNMYLDFSKLDKLYRELYTAMKSNSTKKITLYRGRIIRELKKKRSDIEKYYSNVEPLMKINEILNDDKNTEKIINIKKILLEYSEKKYSNYLMRRINNLDTFKEVFFYVWNKNKVEKIELYKNALQEELKYHRQDLKERYSKEFLDKKISILNLPIVLLKSIGLSILKLNNTINEISDAKTKRMKNEKIKEALKDLGIVISTPIINVGKFAAGNWYTLYNVYRNYSIVKEKKDSNENKINKEEKTNNEPKNNMENKNESTANKKEEIKSNENTQVDKKETNTSDNIEEKSNNSENINQVQNEENNATPNASIENDTTNVVEYDSIKSAQSAQNINSSKYNDTSIVPEEIPKIYEAPIPSKIPSSSSELEFSNLPVPKGKPAEQPEVSPSPDVESPSNNVQISGNGSEFQIGSNLFLPGFGIGTENGKGPLILGGTKSPYSSIVSFSLKNGLKLSPWKPISPFHENKENENTPNNLNSVDNSSTVEDEQDHSLHIC